MFRKVLIANRGEIAIRIMRTLSRMGIKSVAVYSEADTNSLYVQQADEAVYIGPSPADQSYLDCEKILTAVNRTGADAVHPGYGFLSENTKFAQALEDFGVTFIGPKPKAIAAMGDKIEAKKLAEAADVSTVPGYMGVIKNADQAIKIANQIGFPVMVKAAAGGGGKGMRVVHSKSEIKQAFSSATNEAKNSFADSRIFIEKFIEKPRHIEIQVIADHYGNIVCLGERECSIQRHHQKVIEEAPSPFIDEKTRKKMYNQVVSLCKKVKYTSAGTIEFIVDPKKNFYFLEMNTRLQVEHPVTEMITGYDIVELMVRIADGEKLPFTQKDVNLKGWAMESRVYAEDPTRGFLPSSGRITEYKEPLKNKNIRIDSGVYEGGEVSQFYDPMIAKLVTYGESRKEAIEHMQNALSKYVIRGVSHNISFLEAVMNHQRFQDGDFSTNFIAEEYPGGFSGADLTEETAKVFLSVSLFIFLQDAKRASAISGRVPGRERQLGTRWVITIDDKKFSVMVRDRKSGYDIKYGREKFNVGSNWILGSRLFHGVVDGRAVNVHVEYQSAGGYVLTHAGSTVKAFVRTPRVAELENFMPRSEYKATLPILTAPISGLVVSIKVKEGDKVEDGQDLLIMEAMKMENIIMAERDGVVSKINIKEGDNVHVGQVIIEFA